jgi:hypothetical protein
VTLGKFVVVSDAPSSKLLLMTADQRNRPWAATTIRVEAILVVNYAMALKQEVATVVTCV